MTFRQRLAEATQAAIILFITVAILGGFNGS